jgi:integrase
MGAIHGLVVTKWHDPLTAYSTRYQPLLSHLKRFNQDVVDNEVAAHQFLDLFREVASHLAHANLNLWLVKKFGTWAVKQGHWTENYFASIRPLKVERAPRRDKPFTAEEVNLFLSTIKTDPNYFSYHDFCYCLFHLGCRPSELIGLRWGRVDLVRHTVTICESLSRGDDGKTAGYARKRKSTKTGATASCR